MPIRSEVYDRKYFLSDCCEGWERFQDDAGLSELKARLVPLLAPGPGVSVLDAGCGRGEVLLACARAGSPVAGVDYAEAAVELTRETLSDFPGADVRRADLAELPWPEGSFDRALLGDVIEHLDPPQADAALGELRRVLRPGGSLVVHTAPNRLFTTLAWPVARIALRIAGRGESARGLDQWLAVVEPYHVNEQSPFSLRRALRRAGFSRVRVWVSPDVLRSGGHHHLTRELDPEKSRALRALARLAGTRPLRTFLGNDVYAVAIK